MLWCQKSLFGLMFISYRLVRLLRIPQFKSQRGPLCFSCLLLQSVLGPLSSFVSGRFLCVCGWVRSSGSCLWPHLYREQPCVAFLNKILSGPVVDIWVHACVLTGHLASWLLGIKWNTSNTSSPSLMTKNSPLNFPLTRWVKTQNCCWVENTEMDKWGVINVRKEARNTQQCRKRAIKL